MKQRMTAIGTEELHAVGSGYLLRKIVSGESCMPYRPDLSFVHPSVPGVQVYMGEIFNDAVAIISLECVNPDDFPNATRFDKLGRPEKPKRDDGLTEQEGMVMDALCKAFSAFKELESQHPDELREFVDGIHQCQDVLALRVVRRDYPAGWRNTANTTKPMTIVTTHINNALPSREYRERIEGVWPND